MKTVGNYPFKTAFVVNAVLNVPFCFNAIVINVLVILSIGRSHSVRKAPANLLLIGLALSDLGVGLIVQPFFMTFLLSYAETGAGTFTCLTSVAVSVFGSVLTSVSFGSVVSVSIERYIALCLHLRYEDIVTVKKSAKLSDNALAYWWNIAFHLCVAHSKIQISFLFHSNTSVSSNFIRGLHQNLSNHSLSPETNHKY